MSRAKTPGSISRVASAREGKELRGYAPRSSQAVLKLVRRRDPVAILAQTDTGRVEALLPIRYGRMLQSPFAFLRGSAALMAFDLAHGPVSTIRVQACGDCHLMNFGAFATPERQLVFDLNDFDETLPAPFEWDVKRLAASIWVAGRYCRFGERPMRRSRSRGRPNLPREARRVCAVAAVTGLVRQNRCQPDARDRCQWEFGALELGVDRAGGRLHGGAPSSKIDRDRQWPTPHQGSASAGLPSAPRHSLQGEHGPCAARVPRLVTAGVSRAARQLPIRRCRDQKSPASAAWGRSARIALLLAGADDALFLQIKQARRSVLEPYAGKSAYRNHGRASSRSASD